MKKWKWEYIFSPLFVQKRRQFLYLVWSGWNIYSNITNGLLIKIPYLRPIFSRNNSSKQYNNTTIQQYNNTTIISITKHTIQTNLPIPFADYRTNQDAFSSFEWLYFSKLPTNETATTIPSLQFFHHLANLDKLVPNLSNIYSRLRHQFHSKIIGSSCPLQVPFLRKQPHGHRSGLK